MNEAIIRIVIFLIRKRLGLKKGQMFRFTNQLNQKNYYFFTDTELIKVPNGYRPRQSSASLNYLLSDKCEITTK